KIMHEKVVNWLDNALVSGQVPQGDFLFHGRLQKPSVFAKDQSGVMQVLFDVSNPEIDYKPGWPVAGQGKGKIDFLNSGMSFDFTDVKYAKSTVDEVHGSISDFRLANLLLDIKTETDAKDLLATLSRLPILNAFDTVQQKTKLLSGPVSSEIKLDIPLTTKLNKKVSVTAKADLKAVSLSIPEWMLDFKDLKGQVEVDNQKITAPSLIGKFYDDNINLSIKPDVKRNRTDFHLMGEVHSQNLLTLTPPSLHQPVSGKSPWDVSVSVRHIAAKKSPILEVSASSSLLGTKIDFPQPATVLQTETQPLNFRAKLFDEGKFSFDLSLADTINASSELNFTPGSASTLKWLNVYVGGFNTIKDRSGVVIKGKAERIDLNDWFEYKDHYFSAKNTDSSSFLQQINSLDLDIDEMILGNQQILNSKIKIENNGALLLGSINSEQIKGDFELPYKPDLLNPFKTDLEYMKLKKSASKREFNIDIEDMPDLYIKSKAVSYEQLKFSNLTLSTKNDANKFIVDQLDFSHEKVTLKSSGHWHFEPVSKEHVSVFNIAIKGSKFGQTVNKLGLGETISGGKVDFNGQIGWGGELYSMNWPTLIGEVDLKLTDGFLRNVDPGAGRFVGLLSFNALPKRLFLDFGDVLKEGMQFNKIKGKFKIKGEILDTNNASMDSVSAKVRIKGETNLRRKTYDQTMIITPKISDTLPILGTLAAGNTVGWGLLLLQKIFKKPIEKSIGIEYKVTGSWEKPQVKLVKKPKIKQESESIYDADR
ncbi:MAG: hypothetical protein HON46_17865, partial [Gammaproteobacteria bacterium]|nr:hypothetical protein [Gammaproteobacteria bacterium]MBT6455673.1 hypothetical protein [Gammaproteobacteria bacterium]